MKSMCSFVACVLATGMLVSGQSAPSGKTAPGNQPARESQQPTTATTSDQNMTEEQAEANIQLMREDIRSQRKKMVAANMPLTEAEAMKFWPVYDRYMAEMTKVNDNRYALIKEYAQNYRSLTDQQAGSLLKKRLALDENDMQVRTRFVPEFEKVISPKKTALFYQIDHRLSMLIELQLASEIPMVKP